MLGNANVDETLDHLFFECTFKGLVLALCWDHLGYLPVCFRVAAGSQSNFWLAHLHGSRHLGSMVYLVNEKQSHLDGASPSLGTVEA